MSVYSELCHFIRRIRRNIIGKRYSGYVIAVVIFPVGRCGNSRNSALHDIIPNIRKIRVCRVYNAVGAAFNLALGELFDNARVVGIYYFQTAAGNGHAVIVYQILLDISVTLCCFISGKNYHRIGVNIADAVRRIAR